MNDNWRRVTRKRRCPICDKPDWCMVAVDGRAAICPRVEDGARKYLGEAGWLHRLDDPLERIPLPDPVRPTPDFSRYDSQCRERMSARDMKRLSGELGVSASSLEKLHAGRNNGCYTFPMRSNHNRIIGIRLRSRDGHKFAVRGSRSGLFIPDATPLRLDWIAVAEGPTDTAALLDWGFPAVGRPSCSGGVDMLVELVCALHCLGVAVFADCDRPGMDGARRLVRTLRKWGRTVKLVIPPEKDARQWLKAGATITDVMNAIRESRNV